MATEKKEFKTEVQQLLDLVIHSLYSNKDIFLRELISNGSDAIDKLRFNALSDKKLLKDQTDFRIKLFTDNDAKTLIIEDNGIGMTKDEFFDASRDFEPDVAVKDVVELFDKDGELDGSERTLISAVESVLRFLIIALGAVFIADALGFNLTSLIAGLGISGLALALAAKDTIQYKQKKN